MPNRVKIAASILAADFANLGCAVREAEAGGADSIHIDMMDGHYVRNITFGLDLIPALRPHTRLPLVPHLELSNPDDLIVPLANCGSDMIVIQEDTCPDLAVSIHAIRSRGIAVGVGVNPDRPLDRVVPFLNNLDLLIVMSVPPGFGGQPFDASVLAKVSAAREWREQRGHRYDIGMDGGINEQTLGQAVRAGCDYLIVGSAIFGRDGIVPSITRLRQLIAQAKENV